VGRDPDPAQLSGARPGRARDEHARAFAPRGARIAFLSLLVLATAWILASAQDRGPIEGGETYRRPLSNDPASLDPARIRDVHSLAVTQQIFDGLVQFDHKLTITPALAQHWKASRDLLTWTFTLRKGVKFHHGREVTADDVIYSLTRIVDPRTKSGAADLLMTLRGAQDFREGKARQISGLAALDPYTIQVSLTEATVPLVALLAGGHAKILPREIVEQLGEGFGAQPVGTGPFRFVRWDRGQEIVLAANSDYFDGAPRLARILYRIFAGGQVDLMYQEFESGGLEDSPVPSKNYSQVVGSQKHLYVRRPMFSNRHYGFNTTIKPLDDRRVRQAIIHAIDREAIVEEDFFGRHAFARGILPPGTHGYNPKLRGYAHDPSRARELLGQAGYAGGRGLPPIAFWSSVKHEGILREHERISRDLAAVGVRAEFHYLADWPAFLRGLEEKRFPAFLHAWFADVPDPDNFLFKLFHSRSSRNYVGYVNPVVDGLLLDARRTKEEDPLRRMDLYRRAEELILEDAAIMPVWHYAYERLFQPYVRSVEVNGLGDPYVPLRKIWLDRSGRRAG
jgi:peptide/nickel transport system substrate-binding protein/oligopeptide transport system substrate-binding protein